MDSTLALSDKMLGMLIGVAIGDALGAPYEFKTSSGVKYTGLMTESTVHHNRFHGTWEIPPGQFTDDTEMTLCLASSLINKQGYDRADVVTSYMTWANSGIKSIGRNTRELFKGIKTIKGFENRLSKKMSEPSSEWSQSNGSLMRCSPLVALNDFEAVIGDASLSNFHPVCLDTNLVYVNYLRQLMLTNNKKIVDVSQTKEVKAVINDALHNEPRDLTNKKGWCLHALYASIRALNTYDTLQDALDWVIGQNRGSDTDTNAAITGALMGAYLGYSAIAKEERTLANIKIMYSAKTNRPIEYGVGMIEKTAAGLAKMMK